MNDLSAPIPFEEDFVHVGSSDPQYKHTIWLGLKSWFLLQFQNFIELIALKKPIDNLYLVGGGHIFFQTLVTATRHDIFAILAHEPQTNTSIAAKLNISDNAAKIILLGLTTLNLVKRSARGFYRNTFLANKLLRSDVPGNILPIIEWQAQINYRALSRFHDATKLGTNIGLREIPGSGHTLYQKLAANPELERVFQDAMQCLSMRSNPHLIEHGEFWRSRHIIDIGGGNGTNLIHISRRWPHIQGTLFDLESVCRIAQENFRSSNLTNRLFTAAGDCFTDPLPYSANNPMDCILLSHFCTIWSEAQNIELFKKCHARLPKKGRLLIFNMMQNNKRNGPLSAAMGSPYFLTLATGGGMLFAWQEYEEMLRKAGFSQIRCKRLPMDHGLVEATRI